MNSPIYALFDDHFRIDSSSLSTVAFKAIASAIFDRSLRIHSMFPVFCLVSYLRYSNHSSKILGPEMEGLGRTRFLLISHSNTYHPGWILSQAEKRLQRYHTLIQTCIPFTLSYSPRLSISISTT